MTQLVLISARSKKLFWDTHFDSPDLIHIMGIIERLVDTQQCQTTFFSEICMCNSLILVTLLTYRKSVSRQQIAPCAIQQIPTYPLWIDLALARIYLLELTSPEFYAEGSQLCPNANLIGMSHTFSADQCKSDDSGQDCGKSIAPSHHFFLFAQQRRGREI